MAEHTSLSLERGSMHRRSFLKHSVLLGLGVASSGLYPVAAQAVRFDRKQYKVSRTRLAMGTFVSMTLVHPSRDQAEEAMGLAYEEIDRLTGLMNRFDHGTAVGQLNRDGALTDVPPEVMDVVERGLAYCRRSGGAFDISVKPVVDLFKEAFGGPHKAAPEERRVREAMDLVGSDRIAVEGRTIRFTRPGMGITLDGIAKGYIVDRASDVLTKNGIENHLINAGGDIRTMGVRDDKKPWTIAVEDPRKRQKYPDVLRMTSGAIATSGNYEIYFDREKMFHHIVDPRTGLSPRLNTSVSVTAPTAVEADALSTTVFVMEPREGTRFMNTLAHRECLIITNGNKTFRSSGWKGAAS